MQSANVFHVTPKLRIMLRDHGVNAGNVLCRAGLPEDLFTHKEASLTTGEYFRMWRGMEDESNDPLLPLKIGRSITAESFNPPVFAALCSPDLNTALSRLSVYKRLICPMALDISKNSRSTNLEFRWLETVEKPPASLSALELVIFVQLARMATRERIVPLKVTAPQTPLGADEYEKYFGVPVRKGASLSITFSAQDAARPFLTANESMWEHFEPSLRQRLSELDGQADYRDRVRGALLELLPSGEASIDAVSSRLGIGSRTLQRRLRQEGESFQSVLNQTREDLARHYLGNSSLSGAEIAFLLGYENPNSFFRAFHKWTGQTTRRASASSGIERDAS